MARDIPTKSVSNGVNAFAASLSPDFELPAEFADEPDASFIQLGAGATVGAKAKGMGEQGQCEMCMFAIHQSQFGRLPTCGASTSPIYSSWMCVQVVRSMLRFAKDVMDALKHGCYRYDKLSGWETEKPCSAHAICGRLYNVYDLAHSTLCPADPFYAFRHRMSEAAPKVYNPLLPFALKWYKDLNASSVAQDAESGFPL